MRWSATFCKTGGGTHNMTLQLLHSEFPYIWGKFDFLFYQCKNLQIFNLRTKKDLLTQFCWTQLIPLIWLRIINKRLSNTVLSMWNIFCMEFVETNAKARSQKYFRFPGHLCMWVCVSCWAGGQVKMLWWESIFLSQNSHVWAPLRTKKGSSVALMFNLVNL
jgi:hypothetical protein